jgi:hypothetical protein
MALFKDEPRSETVRGHVSRPMVVVVVIEPCETKEQAWRRHLEENPQDCFADVRIFHLGRSGSA